MLLLMPFWLLLLSLVNGTNTQQPKPTETLVLKWNKSYAEDTIDKSVIGLEWALSYCGALLPNAPYAIEVTADKIAIQVSELGFDDQAIQAIQKLHLQIEHSQEYKANKSIDLGRYVALLIGASEHYYAITGVPKHLDVMLSNYELTDAKGYINNSAVSHEHRIIRFSEQRQLKQIFVASEIDSLSGRPFEYETIDIMPNGQLRYGVFDANGNRINTADPLHSDAGKPAKCMWCHESIIQPLFKEQKDFTGYLTFAQLKQKLAAENQAFHEQKIALKTGVDFLKNTQNTNTELLYIAFMEPSIERLSLEWTLPVAQVKSLLQGLPTHTHKEFPFLGLLYNRNEVEAFAPKKGLPVSSSVREYTGLEVNHLN